MSRRREPTLADRCRSMLGLAVVVAVVVCGIGVGATMLRDAVAWYFGGR